MTKHLKWLWPAGSVAVIATGFSLETYELAIVGIIAAIITPSVVGLNAVNRND